MLRIYLPRQEMRELPPIEQFRNIDETMIKIEFMRGKGGLNVFTYIEGGYENF